MHFKEINKPFNLKLKNAKFTILNLDKFICHILVNMSEKSIITLLQAVNAPIIAYKKKEFFFVNDCAGNALQSVAIKHFNSFVANLELNELFFPFVTKKYWNDKKGNIVEFELNISRYEHGESYLLISFKEINKTETQHITVEKSDLIRKKLGLFEVFINQIKEGVLVFDTEGKLVYKNGAAEKLVRISDGDLKKIAIWEIFKYFQNSIVWKNTLLKADKKKDFRFTEKIKGKYLLIDFQKRSFEGDNYYLLICNDITEKFKDKIALEEKDFQIDYFQKHFPVALFQFHVLKNKVHYFHYVSDSFKELFGFKILTHYKSWLSRLNIHPEDVSSFLEATQQSILYNEKFKFTGRMLLKDNNIKWFEASAIPVFHNNKIVFNGIVWDISQQKIADFEIKKRREFNDSVLFNLPADIAVFDKNHNYLFINPNGIADPELRSWMIGKNDFDYCAKKGFDNTMAIRREEFFQEAKKNGKQVEWVDEVSKNNRTYYILRRFYPFFVEGEFAYMIGYGIDISDIKNLQNILSKTEKQNNLIMQSSMEGIVIIDEDCTISFWNAKAQKIFGWSLQEVIGKSLPELILSEENRCFEINAFFKKIDSSGQSNTTLDLLAIDRNKKTFPIELTMISVDDLDYKSKYFVFIRDISSRKEKELQIQQQNEILKRQNTELEQFNYIASHDLQEPLLTIIGYSDLLLEEFSNDLNEEGKLFLDFIHNSANRMRFLISGLLEYNRINKSNDVHWLDLNNTLSDVIDDLSVNIKESNALVHYDTMPTIQCYPIFIRLLFQNLISNALKFRNANTAADVFIQAKEVEDNWQFSVTDNGIGIEEKYFNQIFQIFRRLHTSEEYSGFGIGLAHCKKIVDIHNGIIWIESKVNEGTTFYFTISKKLKNDN